MTAETYANRVSSSKIETLNGHFVDPLNMDPADIRIEDIAHALAMQCRFSGYTRHHYSVAEHSVNVARLVARMLGDAGGSYHPGAELSRRIVRQALLHDATEAYLVDLPSPIKRHFPEFRVAEKKLWAAIAKRFDVPEEMHPFVKEVDGRICTTEKVVLLSPDTHMTEWRGFVRDFPPYVGDWNIVDVGNPEFPVPHSVIRKRFLDFYETVREA